MKIDFASAHNDYLDPDRHLNTEEDCFVEEGPTEADRAAEAAYWERQRAIELAADAQVKELEVQAQRREVCPDCGAEMEWEDSDSDIGRPGLWWCPDCEE